MAYSHVILTNIEWGEGGKRTFIWLRFPFFSGLQEKIVFFEMCLNRFCARLHVVQFDLIISL